MTKIQMNKAEAATQARIVPRVTLPGRGEGFIMAHPVSPQGRNEGNISRSPNVASSLNRVKCTTPPAFTPLNGGKEIQATIPPLSFEAVIPSRSTG